MTGSEGLLVAGVDALVNLGVLLFAMLAALILLAALVTLPDHEARISALEAAHAQECVP